MIGRVLLAIALSIIAPRAAKAHGRPPYVERIAFDPSDPARVILQFSFGLMVSDDGGARFRWVCAEAYGVDATWEDPDLAVSADGALVIGSFDGPVRGDLCTFERSALSGTFALDLASDPRDADAIWAATSRGEGEPDRLHKSEDGGRTWAPMGEPIDALLVSVALAPSDPLRVYASAVVPATDVAPRRALLLRSDDGGARFEELAIPIVVGELSAILAGVDPRDADRLFVRMEKMELDLEPERLLMSADGGRSFDVVLEQPQLRALAITEDDLFAGSALGGIFRADPRALVFTEVSALAVRCLVPRGETLWVCADEAREGFSLGRSIDGGRTVEPVMVMRTVHELAECPSCSATGSVCPAWMDDLHNDYAMYLGATPIDAGVPDAALACTDGGAFDAGTIVPSSAGCGCRVTRGGSGGGVALAALLLVLLRRRARCLYSLRRRQRSTTHSASGRCCTS